MSSLRNHIYRVVLAIIVLTLLAAGCAQQDLYEPPGAPFTRIGQVPLPSQNEGVAALGNYAFVAGGQAGLHAIDISNPSQPVLLQTFNTLKYSESVEVVRTFVDNELLDTALVVEGTEGVTTYDISDPGNIVSYGTSTTAVFGNRIFIDQPEDPNEPFDVYLAESWKGVRVFESVPAQPGILAYNGVFVGTNGYAEGIVVKNGYAYVADDEMGVAVLDVRVLDLDAVELVSWADSPGEALDIDVTGDYAFVADGYSGLAVYEIDAGQTPVRVAQLSLEGKCRAIAVRDDLAVLAAQGAGVHFVDISNPRSPVFMGRILTEYAMDLCLTPDGYALVADREEGMIVMRGEGEFADTTAPGKITSLEAAPFGLGTIRLQWYAAGDDNMVGQAARSEVRMATAIINDETTWSAAAVVGESSTPAAPGQDMELLLTDLEGVTERFFAVRTWDEAGNMSALSNCPSTIPGTGILLADASLDIQAGTGDDTYTYEVTYVFPSAPTVYQVVIDGTGHDMTAISTEGYETLYRYSTTLAAGPHDYAFHFEAADAPVAETDTEVGPIVGVIVFEMGSSDTTNDMDPLYELGREVDEWRHTVVLSDSVRTRVTEVTQQQWIDAGLANPSYFSGADRPVESVTWFDAVVYCNALSTADGLDAAYTIAGTSVTWDRDADGWRLPTEAEWEYLSRAGSSTAFCNGPISVLVCNDDPFLNQVGWYCGSFTTGDIQSTRDVRSKAPNAWDIYDMHGNVWEWCWDWYGSYAQIDDDGDGVVLDPAGPDFGDERVLRGGSWYGGSEDCRSANRGRRFPDSTDDFVGLRVVRTIFAR